MFRFPHPLHVLAAAALVLSAAVAVALPVDSAAGDTEPRPSALTRGHIDLFEVTYDADASGLRLSTKDDTGLYGAGAHYRDPEEVTVYVDSGLAAFDVSSMPSDYDFLKVDGSEIFLLPQTQEQSLPWPGWSTERLPSTLPEGVDLAAGTPVSLDIDVTGPGNVFTWQNGVFGGVQNKHVDTVDPAADMIPIARNAHVHSNWAFTRPGTYTLRVTPSAETASGDTLAGASVDYQIHVGPASDAAPTATTTPRLTGSPEPGSILALDTGSWLPTPHSLGRQWLRDGEPVEGATGEEYAVTEADAGHTVSARVTAVVGTAETVVETDGVGIGGPSEDPDPTPSEDPTQDPTGDPTGDPTEDPSSDPTQDPTGDPSEDPTGDPSDPPGPTDPTWEVPNGSVNTAGATVLNDGHIDIASLLEGDNLVTKVKDTTESATPTWRDPERTVLQLLPESRTTVPAGEQWSFLGSAGAEFHQVSQTQQDGLLWPGWSTESIPASATQDGVAWRLERISGPGEFAIYETGSFGQPSVLFNTRDGIGSADRFTIPKNTHAHGSWAFSAEGSYCLGFSRSTTLAAGAGAADDFVLAVTVGRADVTRVDPAACFEAGSGAPTDPDVEPVADADLTEAARGNVRVQDGADGFNPGQLLSVQTGVAHASEWVSLWLHSEPVWLGWVRADTLGVAQVRLPVSTPLGEHRVVVKGRAGTLLGWDGLRVVRATDPGGPQDPGDPDTDPPPTKPGAIWNVANGKVNSKGATVLNNGHIDIASQVQGGRLVTKVKDTTRSSAPTWRDPAKTVLQLLPKSRTTVPNLAGYGFLGKAGAGVYQVAQTQQPGLLWPGWSTESIPLAATQGGVAWALTDMSGPGHFALYETDSFGQPKVLFNTRNGISVADRFTIPKNTHAHGSWAFSAAGNYCLSMQRTTRLSSGKAASDTFVLAVAVGTADVMRVDPTACGRKVDTDPVKLTPPTGGGGGGSNAAGGNGSDGSANGSTSGASATAARCTPATAAAPAASDAGTASSTTATVLSAGHIDYATRIVNGRLQSLVGDDTSGTKVFREPSSTVMWLKPAAKQELPAGFGAIGAAGSTVWQVPQTQNPDLIWLGWSTEALNAGNTRGAVTWRIDSISGPGTVKVYLSGSFGGVQDVVFDNGGSYRISLGVHAHGNWAFSQEGVYRIRTTQTATLANGTTSSDTETLTIAVGDVDPASAAGGSTAAPGSTGSTGTAVATDSCTAGAGNVSLQAAQQASAQQASGISAGTGPVGEDNPLTTLAEETPVPLLLGILGGLLTAGAAGAGLLWWRRARLQRLLEDVA